MIPDHNKTLGSTPAGPGPNIKRVQISQKHASSMLLILATLACVSADEPTGSASEKDIGSGYDPDLGSGYDPDLGSGYDLYRQWENSNAELNPSDLDNERFPNLADGGLGVAGAAMMQKGESWCRLIAGNNDVEANCPGPACMIRKDNVKGKAKMKASCVPFKACEDRDDNECFHDELCEMSLGKCQQLPISTEDEALENGTVALGVTAGTVVALVLGVIGWQVWKNCCQPNVKKADPTPIHTDGTAETSVSSRLSSDVLIDISETSTREIPAPGSLAKAAKLEDEESASWTSEA